MTGIVMWDTALNDQFPPGGGAYAGYVDGGVGDQPNYPHVVSAFPSAHHLSIALFAGHDADALDVEPGAAGVADIAAWAVRQKARGIGRPVIYASVSVMEAEIVPVVEMLPGARAGVRLWTAHYGLGEHICGPKSCGQLSIDADGTQWCSDALGRVLDQSLLRADFFGTPAPVKTWEEILVASIPVIKKGAGGQAVKNWQALLVAHGYGLGATGPRRDGVDGTWGDLTQAATLAFQKAHGITQDGIVGPATYGAALKAG